MKRILWSVIFFAFVAAFFIWTRQHGDNRLVVSSLPTESPQVSPALEPEAVVELKPEAEDPEVVLDIEPAVTTEAEVEGIQLQEAEAEIEAVKSEAEAAIEAINIQAAAKIEAIRGMVVSQDAESVAIQAEVEESDTEAVVIKGETKSATESEAESEAVPEIKIDPKMKVKVASKLDGGSAAKGKVKRMYGAEMLDAILGAEKKAAPHILNVLRVGRKMTLDDKEIIRGGCWDYADAVYNRAGYPSGKRRVVFKGRQDKGPYANVDLIQPGDWLYYINHRYKRIGHSAIFIIWVDYEKKQGLMLSYGGEGRRQPARYMVYDLTNVYNITRPKKR